MNRLECFIPTMILFFLLGNSHNTFSQAKIVYKDSVVYRITFRDTVVYRYDTVRIKHYIHSDTLWTPPDAPEVANTKRKFGWYNPNSWGIGPMVGAWYSPYNGFDLNVGFGVQYYLFGVTNFRNPHMGKKNKKK